MKTSRIIIALALLAGLIVFGLRRNKPVATNVSNTSRGPSFEVNVVRPFLARPLFGLLPGSELRFNHSSSGAKIGSVGHDRLKLSAEGWDLFIVTDEKGGVAPGMRLVFPIDLGGRQVTLRCRPADPVSSYLRTTKGAGSDALDGSFLVKLATCENAVSGKSTEWPPAPLTVHGSFKGLPQGRR